MDNSKIKKQRKRVKSLFLAASSVVAVSCLLVSAQSYAQAVRAFNCPGSQQRSVTCLNWKGDPIDDTVCMRYQASIGSKPSVSQTCQARCTEVIEVEWEGEDGADDGDPLIFDLNGDGITLSCAEEGVMFDMDNDGIPDKTAWIGSDDGYLVLDADGNGIIDNQSELFGTHNLGAFDELALHDSNDDGVIDDKDDDYGSLQIWQDLNQDGISQANELHGLDTHGIHEIELEHSEIEAKTNENTLTGSGLFRDVTGFVSGIFEAVFRFFRG